MEKEIKLYFESLIEKYGNKVCLSVPKIDTEKLKKIPVALHPLYKIVSNVSFPFGEIYTIEESLKQSERKPFNPNWFVFGRDRYFSFWLCSFTKDEDGLSFTYWDHESGNEIDGAVWSDIISFLKEIEEEYEI